MIKNIRLLAGTDDFRLRERVRLYRDGFRQKYPDGEVETLDDTHSLKDLQNVVFTPNLFGGKRLVFLESFWDTEKFEKAQKEDFFTKLETVTDDCSVMIVQPKIDKRLKWSKWLLGGACEVETFDTLETPQIIDWVIKYTQKQGGKISQATARYLVNHCGVDLWHLSQEVQKLVLYAEGAEIDQSMIDQMTVGRRSAVIWDFLEAVSKQNIQVALSKFSDLLGMGESVYQILAMLMREARIHAQLSYGSRKGMDGKLLASATGLHPFVVQKTLPLSKKFDQKKIVKLYDSLFRIDRNIKTGGIQMSTDDTSELEIALEKVMIEVCQE